MTTVIATYGLSITGVNYEIDWDPQDPYESDENFDQPWEGDMYFWSGYTDGNTNTPDRSTQVPPYPLGMRDRYKEGYNYGAWFKLVNTQF